VIGHDPGYTRTGHSTASIYFDYNPPVITEPSVLVAEFSTALAEAVTERMQLSPNPARDVLFISLPGVRSASIQVHAADGRTVIEEQLQGQFVQLSTASLPGGSYSLLVRDTEGSVHRGRFIKH
jgi:hypothetical protein